MNNTRRQLLITTLLLPLLSQAQAGWDPREDKGIEGKARETIKAFKEKDPSLKSFFESAAGWAVFPTVGKGGLGIGGAYGEGVLYQGGKVVGYTNLKQLTIGFQWGGQAYSELIFFKTAKAVNHFKQEKLEFDAQASAVAATVGAAANADYRHDVAVFTLVKGGLMYEATIGGQHFGFTPK
jgi:lipid-binding SYLF domain-containing protein